MGRRISNIRPVTTLLAPLLTSALLIPTWSPVQAQPPVQAPCTGCTGHRSQQARACRVTGQKTIITSQDIKIGNVTILEGEERDRAIATVLKSKDYKNVKQALIERGHIKRGYIVPQIDDAIVGTVVVYVKGVSSKALVAVIPFRGDHTAKILFMSLNGLTVAAALTINVEAHIINIEDRIEDKIGSLVAFSMNGEVKFPKGGVAPLGNVVSSVKDRCKTDEDCERERGPGWCCRDTCELNQACFDLCSLICGKILVACILLCLPYIKIPKLFLACTAKCAAEYLICMAGCYYICCWVYGQVYKDCFHPHHPYCGGSYNSTNLGRSNDG